MSNIITQIRNSHEYFDNLSTDIFGENGLAVEFEHFLETVAELPSDRQEEEWEKLQKTFDVRIADYRHKQEKATGTLLDAEETREKAKDYGLFKKFGRFITGRNRREKRQLKNAQASLDDIGNRLEFLKILTLRAALSEAVVDPDTRAVFGRSPSGWRETFEGFLEKTNLLAKTDASSSQFAALNQEVETQRQALVAEIADEQKQIDRWFAQRNAITEPNAEQPAAMTQQYKKLQESLDQFRNIIFGEGKEKDVKGNLMQLEMAIELIVELQQLVMGAERLMGQTSEAWTQKVQSDKEHYQGFADADVAGKQSRIAATVTLYQALKQEHAKDTQKAEVLGQKSPKQVAHWLNLQSAAGNLIAGATENVEQEVSRQQGLINQLTKRIDDKVQSMLAQHSNTYQGFVHTRDTAIETLQTINAREDWVATGRQATQELASIFETFQTIPNLELNKEEAYTDYEHAESVLSNANQAYAHAESAANLAKSRLETARAELQTEQSRFESKLYQAASSYPSSIFSGYGGSSEYVRQFLIWHSADSAWEMSHHYNKMTQDLDSKVRNRIDSLESKLRGHHNAVKTIEGLKEELKTAKEAKKNTYNAWQKAKKNHEALSTKADKTPEGPAKTQARSAANRAFGPIKGKHDAFLKEDKNVRNLETRIQNQSTLSASEQSRIGNEIQSLQQKGPARDTLLNFFTGNSVEQILRDVEDAYSTESQAESAYETAVRNKQQAQKDRDNAESVRNSAQRTYEEATSKLSAARTRVGQTDSAVTDIARWLENDVQKAMPQGEFAQNAKTMNSLIQDISVTRIGDLDFTALELQMDALRRYAGTLAKRASEQTEIRDTSEDGRVGAIAQVRAQFEAGKSEIVLP